MKIDMNSQITCDTVKNGAPQCTTIPCSLWGEAPQMARDEAIPMPHLVTKDVRRGIQYRKLCAIGVPQVVILEGNAVLLFDNGQILQLPNAPFYGRIASQDKKV